MADNKEILTCPACGGEMTKLFVEDVAIHVDICLDGCGGILFDNRELEKFDEPHENADKILGMYKDKTFELTDESAPRVCSVCGATMMKMGAGSGGVELDCCAFCGAKFLDYGELQRIRDGKRNSINQDTLDFLDIALKKEIDEVTYGLRPKNSSPRRQLVEDIIRRAIYNKE